MKPIIITSFCFTLLFLINSEFVDGRNSLEASAYDQKYFPLSEPQAVEKYKGFAYELLQNQPFAAKGLLAINTFGIGQSLAVVNENVVLNISSSGIEDVLKIGCHKITAAYKNLINILSEDPKIKFSSTIYTQQEDVYLSPGLGKLKTFVNLVDWTNDKSKYAQFINSEIERKIDNKYSVNFVATDLPAEQLVGEYLINIFEYENSWTKQWDKIDEPNSFYGVTTLQIPYMQTTGKYELIEKPNFIIFRIPFEDGKKNLILIRSSFHIAQLFKSGKSPEEFEAILDKLWNDFTTEAETLQTSSNDEWTQKYMNIKMPLLKDMTNVSLSERLRQMGLSKTLCESLPCPTQNNPKTNMMEKFQQLTFIDFNTEKLSLTSITGTKNIGDVNQQVHNKIAPSHAINRRSPDDDKRSESSTSAQQPKQIPVGEPIETYNVELNQPFYWMIQDNKIGPIFAGGFTVK